MQTVDANVFITISDLQIDNMVPNSPFPVALAKNEAFESREYDRDGNGLSTDANAPMLVVGLCFAPKHSSGILVRISYVAAYSRRILMMYTDLNFSINIL
jgi:hypothetical protein